MIVPKLSLAREKGTFAEDPQVFRPHRPDAAVQLLRGKKTRSKLSQNHVGVQHAPIESLDICEDSAVTRASKGQNLMHEAHVRVGEHLIA